MSVGQVLGTLSLAMFGYAVLADLRERLARGRSGVLESQEPAEPPRDDAGAKSD